MSQVEDLHFDVLALFFVKEGKEEMRNAWAMDVKEM